MTLRQHSARIIATTIAVIAVAALITPAAASAPPGPSHSTPAEPPASVATANAKSAAGVLMASYDPEKAWWPSSWWNSAVALQTIEDYMLRTGELLGDPLLGDFTSRAIDDS